MATSPNYSWPEPDNTDLVKNGALAMRTLGNAIDTTMATMTPKSTYTAKGSIAAATAASTPANLAVGANNTVLQADSTTATGLKYSTPAVVVGNIVTAKGDVIAATASGTVTNLAVGTNGQVLTADSTAATGLKWATSSSGGGMTLLSTTTLSGSSTSISITPTGYNQIAVFVSGVTNGSNGNLFMGINSDTTAGNYVQAWYGTEGTVYYSGANVGVAGVNAIIPGQAGYLGSNSANFAQFMIFDPNGSTRKVINASSAFYSGSSLNAASNSTCNYVTTSALSSIQLKTTVGTFTAGTALVYGVK